MSAILNPSYQLTYTLFPHIKITNGQRIKSSFDELVSRLGSDQVFLSKSALPAWRPAITADNSRTAASPITELCAIVGDYDAGEISIQEASSRLKQAGIAAYLHTSASHTAEKPRWRVVCPLSKPITSTEYPNLVSRLNGALAGVLAPESWESTRAYFYGRVGGVLFEDLRIDGSHLDIQAEIKPIPKPQRPVAKRRLTAIPVLPPSPLILDALQEAIKFINADDRAIWIKVGMALSSLKNTPHEEKAKVIWLHWSATSPKHKDADEKAWETLEPKYLTYSYVFRMAEEAGWLDYIKTNATLVINHVLNHKEEWALLAAQLSPVAASLVVDALHEKLGHGRRALNAELKEATVQIKDLWRKQHIEEAAEGRIIMMHEPENIAAQASKINDLLLEHAPLSRFMRYGTELVFLTERVLPESKSTHEGLPPPAVVSLDNHISTTLCECLEPHVMFVSAKGTPLGIPPQIYAHLLSGTQTRANETVGLLNHPIVLRDGTILAQNGLDPTTKFYLYGIPDDLPAMVPYTLEESKLAYQRLLRTAFQGFELMTPIEEATAMSFLFTSVERKEMAKAPGCCVQATTPAVGKTTLAQAISAVITGREPPVWGFPDSEAEVAKIVLSLLSAAPEAIIFDNISQGSTFKSETMARVMTASRYEGRILGITENREVSTAVVIWITGNNFKFAADEVSRWLTLVLSSKSLHPEDRIFKVDIVKHNIIERWNILRDVVGIVAGYLKYGSANLQLGTRFPDWNRLVREPIHWVTGIDLHSVLRSNESRSDIALGHTSLVVELHKALGTAPFTAGNVLDKLDGFTNPISEALHLLSPNDRRLEWTAQKINKVLCEYAGKGVEDEAGIGWCIKHEVIKKQHVYSIVKWEV